ncbi:ribosomal-protein-alanine N-acetyltransferase [Thiocystis violacea]|nr:ribosomal-protein-alanine N-acetyltransferase [Thiocystis violacea]
MRESDLATVLAVECAAYDFPWAEGVFRDCLRVGYCCWVGEIEGVIVAYGIMSVAVGECHVFNLCVHPSWQGKGLGRRMLRHLLALAVKRRAETAFLEVRASNVGARALYASEGFCEIGTRRSYYPSHRGREDATVLARELVGLDGAGADLV